MKRFILILVLAVVIIPALLFGVLAFELWYSNNYKSVVQVLETDYEKRRFVLMTDIAGLGDQSWYVYQTRSDEELTDAMREGHNRRGALLWNYSETGDHTSEPEIEIVDERYLVFSRGGLFHALYDLEGRRVLINEESPWGAFLLVSENNADQSGNSLEERQRTFHQWKIEVLHNPILRILKQSETRD